MKKLFICVTAVLMAVLSGCELNVNMGVTSRRNNNGWAMTYALFNSEKEENFNFESGDTLIISTENDEGQIYLTVKMKNSDPIYEGKLEKGEFSVNVTQSGRYTVRVEGEKAKGKFEIEKRSKNAGN